jgi:hypothetical protein
MWTKERLEERAKVLFSSEWVSPELNARNQQEWVKSVQALGKKWLFAENIKRKGVK